MYGESATLILKYLFVTQTLETFSKLSQHPIARTPVPLYPKTNNKNEAMPVQFSTLFLISLFSTALALSGCVGSDNSSAPKKPNQPSSDNNTKPGDKNPGVPNPDPSNPDPSNPDPSSPGGNNETGGNNGSGSTTDPVSCNAPDTSITDTSFGDVGNITKYNIDDYTYIDGESVLTGTWVIIGNDQSVANTLGDNSLNYFQKQFLVIKDDGAGSYNVANCAGGVITKDIKACVDANGEITPCTNVNKDKVISVGTEYKQFTGFISTPKEINGEVNLPVFGLNGATFVLEGTGHMKAKDDRFIAKKIDNKTNSLGNIMISSLKDHTITKHVYLLELTPEELKNYAKSAEEKASIIKDLKPEDFSSGNNFLLSTKTSSKSQSQYSNTEVTCITHQALFTRQCKSEQTNSLSLMTLTSSSSHHFLAATDSGSINRVTAYNKTVIPGENKGRPNDTAGTVNDNHTDLAFTETETASGLKLTTKTSDKRYEASFIKLCNGTEEDYKKYPSNDCFSPNDDKRKIFKVLIETTYEASNSELDININTSELVQ